MTQIATGSLCLKAGWPVNLTKTDQPNDTNSQGSFKIES